MNRPCSANPPRPSSLGSLRTRTSAEITLHFTTAPEMTNIALAACGGSGNPGECRNYRLQARLQADRPAGATPDDRDQAGARK